VAAALRLPEEVIQVVGASYDLLVVVPDAAIVRAVTPDLGLISRLPFRGVIVTAAAGTEHPYHFSSRFFAPAVGIAEDSVTGSAHCTLAPYWGVVLGKRIMRAVRSGPAQRCSSPSGILPSEALQPHRLRPPARAALILPAVREAPHHCAKAVFSFFTHVLG
jgi:hypothetical protein